MKKLFIIFASTFTLTFFCAGGVAFAGGGVNAANTPKYYKVISVTDGDTIRVEIGERIEKVRLIGINAPELHDKNKNGKAQCFSYKALNKAKKLLLNQEIQLVKDKKVGDRDKYDRLLRYVFLKNGKNFNEIMVKEGYAYEYTYNRFYKYTDEFRELQNEAMQNGKGLWNAATCNGKKYVEESDHIYYTSSHWRTKYFYCDTDSRWMNLSERYLQKFNSIEELLRDFPNRVLHRAC